MTGPRRGAHGGMTVCQTQQYAPIPKFATLAVTVTVKVLQGPRAAVVTVTAPSGNKPARRIAGDVIVTYASALASLSVSGCDPAPVSGPRLGLRGLGLRV